MFHTTEADTAIQYTIGSSIDYHGVGPFDGRTVVVKIRAGEPDTGLRFVRTDVALEHSVIRADWQNFVDARFGTMLGNKHGVTVTYAEHVLTPLHQAGIRNAVIEVDGPEVPRPDGGYASLRVLIERAGIVVQDAPLPGVWVEYPMEMSPG